MTKINLTRLAPAAGSKLLVVGGSGGIGRCLIEAALDNELIPAVFDLPQALENCNFPSEVIQFPVDATERFGVEQAVKTIGERWQNLDCLVNLAGFMGEKHLITEFPQENWEAIFSASYNSTLNACRATLPLLNQASHGAAIVNMSSGLGHVCNPGYGPYSSAKAAVEALTKTIAREFAPHIRCNAVAPGGINTPFLTGGSGRKPISQRISTKEYINLVPLARMGEPEDVVGPILFLLSSAANYMTGQLLYIDGGVLTP